MRDAGLRVVISAALLALPLWAGSAFADEGHSDSHGKALSGERRVIGTVEDIKADQIEVNTGEVQPRFLPLKTAKEKGLPEVKKGDRIAITVNDQNLIVDYHLLDESGQPREGSHHRILKGQIAEPLEIGHERVVIRTEDGKEQHLAIRSQARSKMAAIPIGTDAVFLLDETNKIADVNFQDQAALERAQDNPNKKPPIKGAHRQVRGTMQSSTKDQITIRTKDGKDEPYQIRPLVVDKLTSLSKGEPVVLLVDEDNKVMDIATPPVSEKKAGSAKGKR